jgi:hypothetical protein
MHRRTKVTSPIDSGTVTLYQLSIYVFRPKCDRFEVISDFRSLKNGGNPLPVDGSNEEKKQRHQSIRKPRLYVSCLYKFSL